MSFNNVAGTAIIPTLARIVLGAAFVTQGYTKVFKQAEFSGDDAQRLIQLDVIKPTPVTAMSGGVGFRTVAFQEEQPPAEDSPASKVGGLIADIVEKASGGTDQETDADAGGDEAATPTEDVDLVLPDPIDLPEIEVGAVYEAKAMYHVTVIVHRAGWPEPVWLGRIAAFTELIGGGLLLLGVFSRIWGLGLAITMGVAFYLTSMDAYFAGPLAAADGADGYSLFNRTFAQLGLLVLALGIMLTGPGPLSLDRLLFRPGGKPDVDDVAFA